MENNVANSAMPGKPAVNGNSMTLIVYVLFICGFFTGITAIIGLVLAYMNRSEEKGAVLLSHYDYQIKTFWWGLLWMFVAAITMLIIIGYFIMLFWFVWTIYRCVKGLTKLNRGLPIA